MIAATVLLGTCNVSVAEENDATELFVERFRELLPLASQITIQHRPSTDVISFILANPASDYWIHKVIVNCSHRLSGPCEYLSDTLTEVVQSSDLHVQGCKKFPSSFVRLLDDEGVPLAELLFDHSGKCFTIGDWSYLSEIEFDPERTQSELVQLDRTQN